MARLPPLAEGKTPLIADLDLGEVLAARRLLDPVGHYHRPDVFRLHVDTSPRPPVIETRLAGGNPVSLQANSIGEDAGQE